VSSIRTPLVRLQLHSTMLPARLSGANRAPIWNECRNWAIVLHHRQRALCLQASVAERQCVLPPVQPGSAAHALVQFCVRRTTCAGRSEGRVAFQRHCCSCSSRPNSDRTQSKSSPWNAPPHGSYIQSKAVGRFRRRTGYIWKAEQFERLARERTLLEHKDF
jgi:hypothetical protein